MVASIAVWTVCQLVAIKLGYAFTRGSGSVFRPILIYIAILTLSVVAALAWAMGAKESSTSSVAHAMIALAICGIFDMGRWAIERVVETNADCLVREAMRAENEDLSTLRNRRR